MPNFTNSERAAFNEDLDRYMAKEVAADKREEWIEERKAELLKGEYHPYKPENVQEALAEMPMFKAMALASFLSSASVNKTNEMSHFSVSLYMIKVVNEYWDDLARQVAEFDYDRRDAL
jgi:hypothetical protein